MALSKTNTDSLCHDTSQSVNPVWRALKLYLYRFNLLTGLYMLEPHERVLFHLVVGIFTTTICLYLGVFGRGFVAGWSSVTMTTIKA